MVVYKLQCCKHSCNSRRPRPVQCLHQAQAQAQAASRYFQITSNSTSPSHFKLQHSSPMDMTLCGPTDRMTGQIPDVSNIRQHCSAPQWTLNKHWNNTVTGHGPKYEQQGHEKKREGGEYQHFDPLLLASECTICNCSCHTVWVYVRVPWIRNSSIMRSIPERLTTLPGEAQLQAYLWCTTSSDNSTWCNALCEIEEE